MRQRSIWPTSWGAACEEEPFSIQGPGLVVQMVAALVHKDLSGIVSAAVRHKHRISI
jgi:hypothetical protein